MAAFFRFLKHSAHTAVRAGVIVAECALIVLLCLTTYAVIARYVFNSPSIHALEISVYLLLVSAWMSTGWILKVDRHVRMEALCAMMPHTGNRIAGAISAFAVFFFSVVLVWAGSVNVITAFDHGYRSSSLLRFPMWIPYMLVPIGGILLVLAVVGKCCQREMIREQGNVPPLT